MKKIVFLSYTSGRGGASKVMSLLMNEYATRNWDVTYIVRDIFQSYPLDNKIRIVELGNDSKFSKMYYYKWIRKYFKENKPDVSVSFLVVPNIINILASRGLSNRIVISERNDPTSYKRLYKILIRVFYKFADKIVFQTKRALSYYPKKMQKKGIIIRNPVTISCEANIPKKKIVTAGRLESQKNQRMLIEAFEMYNRKNNEFELYIYGDGSLKEELKKIIIDKNLENKVYLKGNVTNIHECFSDAYVFVLPSNHEGLSNMLLESMMMGLPCISTLCAGADEVIENNENGILVPINDTESLLQALERITSDENLRHKISQNAKRTAQIFNKDKILQEWVTIIGE